MTNGQLLHQLPEHIYLSNHRSDLWGSIVPELSFILFIGLFSLYLIFLNFLAGFLVLFVIEIGLVSVLLFGTLLVPDKSRLFQLHIYESGIIPEYKPITYLIKKQDFFILFKDIVDIHFKNFGNTCLIKLHDGRIYPISTTSNDIEGYLLFCKIILNMFPNVNKPNLNIVKKCAKERQRWKNNEIKEKDYNECLYELWEVNKDFA